MAMTIPGYDIQQMIEESSTATTWRARQESLDRDVAIKILKPEFVTEAAQVEAFLKEARAVAKLKSANIIQVYDVAQHEEALFIVMESVDGHPLSTLLDLGDPMSQSRALSITLSVAQGLADAWHGAKLMHRNIKPANIMIEKGGEVKIANLGMSGITDEAAGFIVGTPSYMSPEQASGAGPIDFTSDMYSLGAVLYHMLTGKMPFGDLDEDATMEAQINSQLTHPQEINPQITPPCAQLIARLMMKDPQKRYSSWEQAINDISKLAAGKMIIAKPIAGVGSTIAAKGAGNRITIKNHPPPRKILTPANREKTAKAATSATAAAASRQPTGKTATATATAEATAARAAQLKKKYAKPTTPLWLKLPLAAALPIFFGWLGYALLWQPYREAFPRVSVAETTPEPQPQPLPPPVETPTQTEPDQQAVTSPAPSTDPLDYIPEPVRQPRPDPVAESPSEPPPPEPVVPALDAIKSSLVEKALSEGLESAADFLDQQPGDEQLASLQPFFAKSNHPETIIANAFASRMGEETYVNMGGRRIEFRVEGVDGDTISTMVKNTRGNAVVYRPAKLKISQLPPAEQRRWLGDLDTPEKAFAAAVLELSTADYASLAKQADNCGALADATRQFARKRIDMLLE